MPKERILITVKTYPTLSGKYGETVCTAGVREDGTWVRLYPVPFRRLEEKEQYSLFDWIECHIDRNTADPRPETFRPVAFEEIRRVGHIDYSNNWRERHRLLLETAKVYTRMGDLIDAAKANQCSLAVFKPTRIIGFSFEAEENRDWDPKKLREIRENSRQPDLFSDESWRETFQFIPKLPYSFSYKFEDETGRESKLRILEWQIGALYGKCLRSCDGNEKQALQKVRQKYFDEFLKKDLHFFLGTTQQFHFRAPNPWMIIGVFPIPHERQLELF